MKPGSQASRPDARHSACTTFRAGAGYSTSDTGQNDYGCRLYHASIAASGLSQAPIFCPHIASNSVTCVQ